MSAPDLTVAAPHDNERKTAHERRKSEQVITDWEQEARRLGRALALMTLNLPEMPDEKWADRFVIAVGPVAEACTLLFYGAEFAALMELPEKPDHSVPMVELIPARYVPVFTAGCIDATLRGVPVRLRGTVDREDGRQEFYRVAFIPFSAKSGPQQRLAFGVFNRRVAESQS